ncbi:MAG TPA: asparagine synthase (glutamine-hydrolyzing) [Alphaproteobacteria bacterium]|nr:asparagine synthase (glutamine-hydrolyzing) [Alphaproteobacteria bacterium]
MCGIAGVIRRRGALAGDALGSLARAMSDALAHRGPDGSDLWLDAEAGVALAHRRLAIIDLSPGGAQPKHSADGRYVITYNGEVYNYLALRRELEGLGHRFSTESDTEVMLAAIVQWGIAAACTRFVGMFAFALWDRSTRTLTLGRDRLGIKPVYYADLGDRFLFGSELKALRADNAWQPALDLDAVVAYLRFAYVPAPRTIYRGAAKLPPGHLLTLAPGAAPALACYWDARRIAVEGAAASRHARLDEHDATERLDALLGDAVKLRMIADVPLGAFLSGGIDSSTVVALMQAQSTRPVKTFSIGFREAAYNEAAYAKEVAAHLGTEHTELIVEPEHARAVIPHLPDMYDEPFADSSQIPTFLVAEMTRRHVTVALSGDGGDEAFAGYNRYFWARKIERATGWLPDGLRAAGAGAVRLLSPAAWDCLVSPLPRRLRPPQLGDKAHKVAEILECDGPDAIYRRLVSQWRAPEEIARQGAEPRGALWDETLARDIPDFTQRMEYLDLVTYLPDDILTKVDRATMAVSLEGRVPLIDHRVVEFAAALPVALKIRDGRGKWLLRQVLKRYVPDRLVERPKTGFGVPIDSWLRGPLKDWAETLLAPERLEAGGVLRAEPIRSAWREHLAGTRNRHYPLWTVLMLQAWRARWGV